MCDFNISACLLTTLLWWSWAYSHVRSIQTACGARGWRFDSFPRIDPG